MSQNARKTAYYGLVTALAMILSYIESLIPINFGIPGAKPGLANLTILFCLRRPYDSFRKNITGAAAVGMVRILATGFLFGNLFAICYSLAGFAAALATQALMEYLNVRHRGEPGTEVFSITAISAVGGVMHNMGQLAVAAFLCGRTVLFYLPWLILFGILAGLVTGILGAILIKRLEKFRWT